MRSLFPTYLCDIGGTNARFAFLRDAGSDIQLLPRQRTADHATFIEALRAAVRAGGVAPKSCIVCAAGPVDGGRVQLTNAAWNIDGRAAAAELGLEQGLILNDFEALALAIPVFRPEWSRPIGGGTPDPRGARMIHGPGTGLGSAALVEAAGKWRAIASEGSHCDFGPVYDDERAIWPHIEPRMGRVTPESLISGPGVRRLHRARLAALGEERPEIADAEIVSRAVENPASPEAETIRLFWRLAARYAGDVALNFLATGGVYLAGGILPRIMSLLDDERFRAVFANKAPYDKLASRIPVRLITAPDAVLRGMAAIARDPDRYAIDYEGRAWRD